MLSRRKSKPSSSNRLRRAKSTASATSPTKSEMLGPGEKQKQAIAAAQHAFGSDQFRKGRDLRLRQSSPNLRPPLSELTVNRRPSVRFSSIAQTTDDGSSAYGDSTTGEDYEATVIRRRSMNHSYRYADSSPEPISSTPSSFRRMARSRSAINLTARDLDVSSVVYSAERSPQKGDMVRKSASFLRGGTEFMPESLRKREERKSFYMPSNQRPVFLPESYRGKNSKGEWGAIRLSVKKKARKISETVFEGVKSLFGKGQKEEKQTMPEQHVPASRMHFRDYMAPEDLDLDPPALSLNPGTVVKAKIRSNFVISKAPTLHFVPSTEMIVSDVGSIHDHYSTPARGPTRKISPSSTGAGTWTTTTSTNWNSTVASRKTVRADKLDNIYEGRRSDTPVTGPVSRLYVPPQRKERYNVDVRRLYSAIVKKMEDPQPNPGYFMPPGIGLLPEEEGIFERHSSAATSRSGSIKGSIRGKHRINKRTSSSTINIPEPPTHHPPPIPEIPKMWLNCDTPSSTETHRPRPKSVFPATSTDAALSACHLQVLKAQQQRRSSPVSSSVPSTTHTPAPFFISSEICETPRSRSAIGLRRAETSTPIPRGTTAMGLRTRNVNVLVEEERKLGRRRSRASIRDFDVGSAVRAQFGDVWETEQGEGSAFL